MTNATAMASIMKPLQDKKLRHTQLVWHTCMLNWLNFGYTGTVVPCKGVDPLENIVIVVKNLLKIRSTDHS